MNLLRPQDLLQQIEAQIRAAQMEGYLHEQKIRLLEDPPADDAPDFEKAGYEMMKQEASASRAILAAWKRKLAKLEPEYDRLKAEVAKEEAKAK